MSRDAARLEVRRAVEATGLGRLEFAKRAKIDDGTLIDMLEGTRWPQTPTRRKIEQALGWPPGRISDLADGIDITPAAGSLAGAIENDPQLLPEAKPHLIGLVRLLQSLRQDTHHAPAIEPAPETPEQTRARVTAEKEARLRAAIQVEKDT